MCVQVNTKNVSFLESSHQWYDAGPKNSTDMVRKNNLKYFDLPKYFKFQYTLKNIDLKAPSVGVHNIVSTYSYVFTHIYVYVLFV